MNHPMWVITKTPTSKAKKDVISDMETSPGKEYWKRNGSSGYFEQGFDGNYTCKFVDEKRANEVAQTLRARTLIGKYTIAVELVG